MRFSQRQGLSSPAKILQIDAIDVDLRNGLWDAVRMCYFDSVEYDPHCHGQSRRCDRQPLLLQYWHNFFKWPVDTLPYGFDEAVVQLRKFFFKAAWHQVYDFIEFTADVECGIEAESFRTFCNRVLERENSGYRFVSSQIVEITSATEIESIEGAVVAADSVPVVRLHLERALELLGDRKNPDYRNSIKESISAVEALAVLLAGHHGATLSEALAVLEKRQALHGGLKRAFVVLYGYTSDADGIRHAALSEPSVSLAEAKFMLVTCSAFVYYLIGKAAELRIELKSVSA